MSESKFLGSDERIKKSAGATVRGDRAEADNQRTLSDGTALNTEERRRFNRSEWDQEVLPTPPKVNGWHFCWLSTTNSSDPIYKRMQRGYEPVKSSEVPGFAQFTVTQGEFAGCVACNEMLLFKIPEDLFQEVMTYMHYEKPMEEEEFLRANLKGNEHDSSGRSLGDVEGFDTLARRVKKPVF